jgi:PST family polysaccharide transporter
MRSSRYWLFISNLGWLTADKLVRMGLGLVVGVAMARYLHPAGFGVLNYAYALVALFTVFAGLGLDSIVQRDLIRNSGSKGYALATCLGLKLIGGILAYGLLIVVVPYLTTDSLTRTATLVMGLSLLNGWSPTFDTWFQSQVQAKFSVYAQNIAFIAASGLRIYLILTQRLVLAFAWAAAFEAFLGAILISFLFSRQKHERCDWRFDWSLAKRWLGEGWALIFSNLAVMIYMRIDQVMLGRMAGEHELGVYSAAVRISEIGYFIPVMLASTLLPSIVRSRGLSEADYMARRQHFFDLNAVIAIAIILPSAVLAKWIIETLYGVAYHGADRILLVHIWSALFVFLGVARAQYLLSENLLRFSLYSTVVGAIINIALNLVLIPRMGGLGCAWATLIAYAVAAFGSSFFSRSVRKMGWQQARALFLPMALVRTAEWR